MTEFDSALSFRMPTDVQFGVGALVGLERAASKLGKRAFLVTGSRSARENGTLDRCLQALPHAVVYEGVGENPTDADCDRAAEHLRASDCDFVVALGGGSPIDAAKAAAVLATNPGACEQFIGHNQYQSPALPIIAIPTTSGAGSEVTPYSVLVSESDQTKITLSGDDLFPRVAIVDPELTLTMPKSVTIASGLDALSQGIEGIISNRSNPISDLFAVETTKHALRHLPRAVAEPDNLDARAHVAYAAMLSGIVVAQTGTTLVHGMGYQYTVEFGITHGLANALLLPPMIRYNAGVVPERIRLIAESLGVADEPNAGTASAKAVVGLMENLGVSAAAKDHGLPESAIESLANRVAFEPRRFRHEPGAPELQDVLRFFTESYHGVAS